MTRTKLAKIEVDPELGEVTVSRARHNGLVVKTIDTERLTLVMLPPPGEGQFAIERDGGAVEIWWDKDPAPAQEQIDQRPALPPSDVSKDLHMSEPTPNSRQQRQDWHEWFSQRPEEIGGADWLAWREQRPPFPPPPSTRDIYSMREARGVGDLIILGLAWVTTLGVIAFPFFWLFAVLT